MTACTYDNPKTMCRECWQDKKLVCSYQHVLFYVKETPTGMPLFFGANIGEWKTGQLVGDSDAIPDEEKVR